METRGRLACFVALAPTCTFLDAALVDADVDPWPVRA